MQTMHRVSLIWCSNVDARQPASATLRGPQQRYMQSRMLRSIPGNTTTCPGSPCRAPLPRTMVVQAAGTDVALPPTTPPPPYPGPAAERLVMQIGGHEVVLETGEIARQANGAIMATQGETILLTTACCGSEPSGDGSFVPFQVNYTERFSAAGRTSGGYNKRNPRQGMGEVLVSRLIDRPLRPMFTKGWSTETQLLSWVLSYDSIHPPEPLAITAAGAALLLSDIPFTKAVAGVRVGYIPESTEGHEAGFVVNPTVDQMGVSTLDLMLAGTADAVLMIEGFCEFLSEEQMLEAVNVGQRAITDACHQMTAWAAAVGKPKRTDLVSPPDALYQTLHDRLSNAIRDAYTSNLDKQARGALIGQLQRETQVALGMVEDDAVGNGMIADGGGSGLDTASSDEEGTGAPAAAGGPPPSSVEFALAWKKLESNVMRRLVLDDGYRADGRSVDQVRPISSRCGLLPRTHGSALFTRGETQVVAVSTLGSAADAQRIDSLTEDDQLQRFVLSYSFPPSSVGECGRVGGVQGRREVGHGNLAERALLPALPDPAAFPYSMRVESTVTESNGSSSMASVCGGTLALLDGGVPLKHTIAGVAMGLILEPNGNFAVLTDILGSEDALGDMDFKVAGSADAVTAFQMDIKVEGITLEIMRVALERAKVARCHILGEMGKANPPAKRALSPYVPRIVTVMIDPSKIGAVIGPGGRVIKGIREKTGVEISCEDDGSVELVGTDVEQLDIAKQMVLEIAVEPEVGSVIRNAVVDQVLAFGCIVRFGVTRSGMVHVSELDVRRTAVVEDAWKEGDVMDVKIIEVMGNGNIRLSRKAVLVDDAAAQGIDLLAVVAAESGEEPGAPGTPPGRENGRRGDRGDRRGRGDRGERGERGDRRNNNNRGGDRRGGGGVRGDRPPRREGGSVGTSEAFSPAPSPASTSDGDA